MTLRELPIGKTATIVSVGGEGALRQHFLDMGLIPTGDVTMVKYAPMGDPVELRIHSYELTLRLADAEKIEIENVRDAESAAKKKAGTSVPHPGLGEGGKFHLKETEHPLPEGTVLGSSQHVGNFPGVTVDRKDGEIRGRKDTLVTDLPGIYSMSPYSSEEIVTRNFVLNEHPKGIINIVDATNIERNLYLTMQLMELNIPMVLALNMMDEVRENGGSIRINQMEEMLGIPVVPISAAKNEGIDELVSHALHVARYQECPQEMDYCDANDDGGAVHRCLHAIMHLIEDHAEQTGIPVRFAAAKLAEGDSLILEQLHLDENEKETLEHIVKQMEKERGLDRAAAIAHMRFDFIEKICDETVVRPHDSREQLRRDHGSRLLPDLRRDRRFPVRYPGYGNHGPGGACGSVPDSRQRQLDDPLPGYGRNLRRRGKRLKLPSGHRDPVLLPVPFGGQRLYGPGGLRDGQAPAQNRLVGPQHRADARGLWLYGARRDGQPHPALRARPQDDDPAHALYELLSEAAHLRLLYGGVLP